MAVSPKRSVALAEITLKGRNSRPGEPTHLMKDSRGQVAALAQSIQKNGLTRRSTHSNVSYPSTTDYGSTHHLKCMAVSSRDSVVQQGIRKMVNWVDNIFNPV